VNASRFRPRPIAKIRATATWCCRTESWWNSAEIREGVVVPFQERSVVSAGKAAEAVIGPRQVHRQIVRLAFHTGDHTIASPKSACASPADVPAAQTFALTQLPEPHVVLHESYSRPCSRARRAAARRSVWRCGAASCLPPCRLPGSGRWRHPRVQLRAGARLLPPVARRHRVPQIFRTVSRASPNSWPLAPLILSTTTARRTRAYSSTVLHLSGVPQNISPWNVRWNQSPGGLVLLRQQRRSYGVYCLFSLRRLYRTQADADPAGRAAGHRPARL